MWRKFWNRKFRMTPSTELINLVSVMCESVLVGAYAVLIGLLFYILATNRRPFSIMHKILFLASIIMFLISVVHLGLLMKQVSVRETPLANLRSQTVLSAVQFVIGDLVLIWRVWVIWGQNYMIVGGPLLMMVVATGLTFTLTALDETSAFFTTVPVALVVGNTTICTLLIAGRIWYVHRQVKKTAVNIGTIHISNPNGFKGALILMIESGVLYALTQICILVLGRTDSATLPIVLNIEVPLIGILTTLIIVLVYFNLVPWRTPSRISVIPSVSVARRWSEASNASTSTSSVDSASKPDTASVYSDTSSDSGGSSSKGHADFNYNYRLEDAEATLAADFPPLPPTRYIVRDVDHFAIDL